MKKITVFIILIFASLLLSACCIVHDWTEATCTEGSYCTRCGTVRNDAIGHDWQADAGILTCSRCGEVDDSEERAALGKPAEVPSVTENSEAPAVTENNPESEAEFEKYAIVPNMAYKEVYPFTTGTRDMSALSTTGEISVTDFGVLPTDSAHPKRDGYEWRYVIIQATFYDDNAHKNGVKVMALCEDYYALALRGTTQRLDSDGYTAYTVISDGEEKECRYKRTGKWSDWYTSDSGRREILYSCLWEIEIPTGYDGTVVGLYSSRIDWPKGAYINEVYSPDSFRLFRIS